MIRLLDIQVQSEDRDDLRGGEDSSPIGRFRRDPTAMVRVDIMASGPDLDRLLAALAEMMPDVRRHVRVPDPPAPPEATRALPPGPPIVHDGILEDP